MSGYSLNDKYFAYLNSSGYDEDLVIHNYKSGDVIFELDFGSNLRPIDKNVFIRRKNQLLEMISVCNLIIEEN